MITNTKVARSHWTKGSTERVNRLRDSYFNYVPSIDIERAKVFTDAYQKYELEDMIVKRALAFKEYLATKSIGIYDDELIVGISGKKPRAFVFCPDISWMWVKDELDTIDTRPQDPYEISEDDREELRRVILPYWEGKSMEEYCMYQMTDEIRNIAVGTNIVFGENKTTVGGGETAVGYESIIFKKGFKGLMEEAQEKLDALDDTNIELYDKKQFYRAMIIVCEGIKIMMDRYVDLATDMAAKEANPERKAELLEIARICNKVPWETPDTYYEAIQCVNMVECLLYADENASGFNVGRVDQYLYPYYLKDKEAGILDDARAQELIECLWIKLAQNLYGTSAGGAEFYVGYQPYHGVTLGGIDKDGKDAANELSFMGLQATMNLHMHTPTINVRVNPVTSDAFMMKLADLIECGTGQPAVHFDPAAFDQLRRNGVKEEDLWNYSLVGCVSSQIPGRTTQWNEGTRYSYPVAVDWALFNGYSHILKRQMGIETGDARNFKTYEEFHDAVEKQLRYLVKIACKSCQINERAQQIYLPKPFRDLCVEGPMEHGLDVMYKGSSYYTAGPGLLATGIADLADAMAAVKKLVYEDQEITMDELLKALEADFEGYEDLRSKLVNGAPKYGNDIPYVDEIAKEFVDISVNEAEKYISIFGSKYMNGLVPVMANVPHGQAVWAIPSGRKAGTPLADGISPFPGYDKKGPTSIIKSVCTVDHTENGAGTLLNMKLTPDLLSTKEGKMKLVAMLRAECALKGYHIQFNVVDRDTLISAQKNPNEYADLLVRVAGYSAFFVDLRKEAQDLIINRTEVAEWQ